MSENISIESGSDGKRANGHSEDQTAGVTLSSWVPFDEPFAGGTRSTRAIHVLHRAIGPTLLLITAVLVLVGTATAQSDPGNAFCESNLAGTILNIFTIIQFGGPLFGGVLALGATVAIPFTRRSDWKKEMKSVRNQGLLWGIIVAPLGTEIVQFILNNVVVGGTSCGF